MAIVLHLATDDDDEEVINSTWYNLILYQADRWATESRAYTPWGFVAEAKLFIAVQLLHYLVLKIYLKL